MKYFLHINDQQQGPFEIDELLDNGLTPDTPVWCDGMADWTPAKDVQDLAWLLAPVQSTPPQFNVSAPPAYEPKPIQQQPPVQQPEPVYEEVPRCRSGLALAIINLCSPVILFLVFLLAVAIFKPYNDAGEVMGAIVIIISFMCTVLGVISLIFAIQSKAAYSRGEYGVSRGKGKAARILGWIGIALMIIAAAVIMILGGTNKHTYSYYGYYYDY
ncbi:MAG: DUF4339 domain-containing protein [Muribaculaceae bacterium]|nr:DUF4339 domain-containing protein [Muribaculaceae bacterium]